MVLAAILVPVIVIFAGLAWGTAMVYGANQEGRRAADLAALATAASLPALNLNASCTVRGGVPEAFGLRKLADVSSVLKPYRA